MGDRTLAARGRAARWRHRAACWQLVVIVGIVGSRLPSARADVLHERGDWPVYDSRCALLPEPVVPIHLPASADSAAFNAPVPHVIHQVDWQADSRAARAVARPWQAWARAHGWHYRLWTQGDLESLWPAVGSLTRQGLQHLTARRLDGACRAIVTLAVLHAHGGLAMAPEVQPPATGVLPPGGDLEAIMPLAGLLASSAWEVRDPGGVSGSVGVSLALLGAAPREPMLAQALEAIDGGVLGLIDAEGLRRDAPLDAESLAFLCGEAPLNRALGGAFTLLPAPTLVAWGMLPQPAEPAAP